MKTFHFPCPSVWNLLGMMFILPSKRGLQVKPIIKYGNSLNKEGRFLITQDLDFSDIRQFIPGTHCGILLVRLHSPSRRNLIDRVTGLFQKENVEQWARCFVVVTDRKVRVLRPSQR